MEGDPFALIEGMTIAGVAVGATQGYIYLRVEYPHALRVAERGDRGGARGGLPRRRRARQRQGASTSRCGSAPARTSAAKKPRCSRASRASAARSACARRCPPIKGLFGTPTIVNNVISLASVPIILAQRRRVLPRLRHGRSRAARCRSSSRATSSAAASSRRRSASRVRELLVRLRRRLADAGGRSAPCRSAGRSAPTCRRRSSTRRSTTRRFTAIGALLGHGGIVAFDDTVDMARDGALRDGVLRASSRAASARPAASARFAGPRSWRPIGRGEDRDGNLALLEELCDTMLNGSLCGLGGMTPFPVQSALKHFPEDFRAQGARRLDVLDRLSRPRHAAGRQSAELASRSKSTARPSPCPRARRSCGPRRSPARQIPKLCATDYAEGLRLLPPVPGRDRRPQGLPGVLHDARRAGHEGPHAESPKLHAAPPQRDGALRLRSSARLRRAARRTATASCRTWPRSLGITADPLRADGQNHQRGVATDVSNPYFAFDPTLCIVCSRCVRACDEMQGTFALTIEGRGFGSQVVRQPERAVPRTPSASRAAPASRPARPPRSARSR